MALRYSPETSYTSVKEKEAWRPGAFRRIPWLALLALVGAVLGIIAAIAILITSDGALISSWTYPPTVYLSIAYTITNILISAAFAKGVTINWWRTALNDGTSLGDLHRAWDHGTSPLAAALSGRHFNFIAFAALFIAITPVNGPLLQRSSSVGVGSFYSSDPVKVPVVSSIQYPTGIISGRGYGIPIFTDQFNAVVQSFNRADNIPANSTNCPPNGYCTGRLTAAGLSTTCTSSTLPFDLSEGTTLPNGTVIINHDSQIGINIFVTTFSWTVDEPGNINLTVAYKDTSAYTESNLAVRNCSLRAATVQYPVTIDGNKSTIALNPNSTIFDDVVLSVNDYELENMYGTGSPIGGYAFALQTRFDASSHLRFVGAAGFELNSTGPTGPQFADQSEIENWTNGMAHIKFTDPTDYLLDQARQLMFRAAIAGGNSSNTQDLQGATQVYTAGVYASHYVFLGIAVAVTFVAILLVLATFNGYWHLGRQVTLSPLEVAKAFNAPLLVQQDSNASVEELVKGAGDQSVKYGAVATSDNSDGKYGEFVQVHPGEHGKTHLEIANSARVQTLIR